MLDTTATAEAIAVQIANHTTAKQAMWILFAVKHITRLGKKDDIAAELAKIENYIHRARTGEWVEELRPKHYGGSLENSDGNPSKAGRSFDVSFDVLDVVRGMPTCAE